MHRDMDLIRTLLLRFERNDQSVPEGRTKEEVAYHVNQMKDAGLVDAIISFAMERGSRYPNFYQVRDITPKGHDFIAAIRSDTFWAKLKKHFEDKAVPLTVELAVEGAKTLARQLLGFS